MIALRGMFKVRPDLPRTMPELQELLYPRDPNQIDWERKFVFINGVPCLNFGTSKGKPMKDNVGFLRWILKNDFSAEVKRIAKEAIEGRYPEYRG
jgi:DNA polymerase-3 subunit epsilon